jgi:hypothetical protein
MAFCWRIEKRVPWEIDAFETYLHYGKLLRPISGTMAEELLAKNAIRPVVLRRRNWIHIGGEEAGPGVAAIVSIVETCRRLETPIRQYMAFVLPGLTNFPINRIAELTPTALATRI